MINKNFSTYYQKKREKSGKICSAGPEYIELTHYKSNHFFKRIFDKLETTNVITAIIFNNIMLFVTNWEVPRCSYSICQGNSRVGIGRKLLEFWDRPTR